MPIPVPWLYDMSADCSLLLLYRFLQFEYPGLIARHSILADDLGVVALVLSAWEADMVVVNIRLMQQSRSHRAIIGVDSIPVIDKYGLSE